MSDPAPPDEPPRWIETAVGVAGRLGLNPVRVRWRLTNWARRRKQARDQRAARAAHARYQHKTCGACGAVQDRDARTCSRCGERVGRRTWQVLRRLGLGVPRIASTSVLLAIILVACYVRVAVSDGGGFGFSLSLDRLVEFGGNLPRGLAEREPWRLATAVFLHAGLLHLGFNLLALAAIGPEVEQLYGRWTMPFLFLSTGVVASAVSRYTGLAGVGIGASGAIAGLIGIVAGWGHRQATPTSRALRNRMVGWMVYVVGFGFLVHADNRAHLGGFLAGGIIGLVVRPAWLRQGPGRALARTMAIVGFLGTVATATAVAVPLSSNSDEYMLGAYAADAIEFLQATPAVARSLVDECVKVLPGEMPGCVDTLVCSQPACYGLALTLAVCRGRAPADLAGTGLKEQIDAARADPFQRLRCTSIEAELARAGGLRRTPGP